MSGNEFHTIVQRQRDAFSSGQTRSIDRRRAILSSLGRAIERHEDVLFAALAADLGKSAIEAYTTEIGFVLNEIRFAMKHLPTWMRPQRCATPLWLKPGRSYTVSEPLGVALIIGPWNYPFQLTLAPAIGALAAGNCVVLKPSEIAPATSAAIKTILSSSIDATIMTVIEGGIAETGSLLEETFDHIFFTGSSRVGRIIMEAAARKLTPLTLELGGKSPCIVCDDVDFTVAVRRIMWGKFLNAGQTCVAPDHVYVPERLVGPFCEQARVALTRFFGEDPETSPDYPRIINREHARRLLDYCAAGTIVMGGTGDIENKYVAPTLLLSPPADAPVMREEIFGPVLPVLPYSDLEAVIDDIRRRPKPLACYVFTADRCIQDRVRDSISCGGLCINDTISHIIGPHLPFGGVGESGFGRYHGRAGFDCFSNRKSVLRRGLSFDLTARYPPYSTPLSIVKKVFRWFF